MKGIIYLGAAIALLRSVAAFLPSTNNNDDNNNQHAIPNLLHLQPGTADPSPFDNAPPHQPPSPSPPNSNFTLGSPNPSSLWAITYTPYSTSLTCLPPTTIIADIISIARSGFTTIRLYSLDCAILPTITATLQLHSLTLILGIPLDDGLDSATAQIDELISWATDEPSASPDPTTNPSPPPEPQTKWPLLTLLLLGNEPLFNSHTTPPTLATYLTTTRAQLRASGYLGPISVNEPLPLLVQHASLLCPHLDVLASAIHPFFHSQITADAAGAYVAGEMEVLGGVCDGFIPSASASPHASASPDADVGQGRKIAVNIETGWPSRGLANGAAVPGVREQRVAVGGIVERVGGRSVVVGWRDEGWREGGEWGVEGSWGVGWWLGVEGVGEEEGEGEGGRG